MERDLVYPVLICKTASINMNDLMGEIPKWAATAPHDDDSGGDHYHDEMNWSKGASGGGGGDIEMAQTPPQQPKYMETFFKEVEEIKKDIDAVKTASQKIMDIHEEALQATTTEKENELSRKLQPLVNQTNQRAKRTKNLLSLLKEETKKLKDAGDIKQSDLR